MSLVSAAGLVSFCSRTLSTTCRRSSSISNRRILTTITATTRTSSKQWLVAIVFDTTRSVLWSLLKPHQRLAHQRRLRLVPCARSSSRSFANGNPTRSHPSNYSSSYYYHHHSPWNNSLSHRSVSDRRWYRLYPRTTSTLTTRTTTSNNNHKAMSTDWTMLVSQWKEWAIHPFLRQAPFWRTTDAFQDGIEQDPDPSHYGWRLWLLLFMFYVASELVFYLFFHWHLIPHANQHRAGDLCHDYPEPLDRVRLCRRILGRLEQKALRLAAQQQQQQQQVKEQRTNADNMSTKKNQSEFAALATSCHQEVIRGFLLQWFEHKPRVESHSKSLDKATTTMHRQGSSSVNQLPHVLGTESSSLASSLSDVSSIQSDDGGSSSTATTTPHRAALVPWTIPGLKQYAVFEFFAWAFYVKEVADLNKVERQSVQGCLDSLRDLTGLVLEEDDEPCWYEPRRISLETVNSIHRPWMVYALVGASQSIARHVLLPWFGFRRVVAHGRKSTHNNDTCCSPPLVAWYRPASSPRNKHKVCLFFHGIAPAGVLCYLPMIQALLGKRQQELVLVENPSVSCQFHALPNFDGHSEQETVEGIQDILDQLGLATHRHKLTLMGHSFGSCPITWMLRRRHLVSAQLDHVVLLDPVTLLLSDPTVMTRFLYEHDGRDKAHIRFLVATELFTEYYLRRHFFWYNSELWLEDYVTCNNTTTLPKTEETNTSKNPDRWTIVLSGKDEIVPAPVVQEHVSHLKDNCNFDNCNLIYWPHSNHANCVMSPRRWHVMKQFLFHDDDDNSEESS